MDYSKVLPLLLFRRSEPSLQDAAPHKSICIVQAFPEDAVFYSQLNKDEEKPNWQKLEQTNLEDCLKYLQNL